MVGVLGDAESSGGVEEFDLVVGTRSGGLLVGEFFLDEVNWLGSGGKTEVVVFEFLVVVLNRGRSTVPGPGYLWSWGMR